MLNQLKEEMLLQIKDTIDKCEKIFFFAVRKRGKENDASSYTTQSLLLN